MFKKTQRPSCDDRFKLANHKPRAVSSFMDVHRFLWTSEMLQLNHVFGLYVGIKVLKTALTNKC